MTTYIINLFGGPGSGKSIASAILYSKLKLLHITSELALEYAKDKVYENNATTLNNQIYIFGKQHYRIYRLLNKVKFVITDSPLLNSIIYDNTQSTNFKNLVLEEFNKFQNINIFIERNKNIYEKNGRLQTLNEAEIIDMKTKSLLDNNNISYHTIKLNEQEIEKIINDILVNIQD